MSGDTGLGPHADQSLDDLDPELCVVVEYIGDGFETRHAVIHDPEYLDLTRDTIEMTLATARDHGAEFCCDCFETAWVDALTREYE